MIAESGLRRPEDFSGVTEARTIKRLVTAWPEITRRQWQIGLTGPLWYSRTPRPEERAALNPRLFRLANWNAEYLAKIAC